MWVLKKIQSVYSHIPKAVEFVLKFFPICRSASKPPPLLLPSPTVLYKEPEKCEQSADVILLSSLFTTDLPLHNVPGGSHKFMCDFMRIATEDCEFFLCARSGIP